MFIKYDPLLHIPNSHHNFSAEVNLMMTMMEMVLIMMMVVTVVTMNMVFTVVLLIMDLVVRI